MTLPCEATRVKIKRMANRNVPFVEIAKVAGVSYQQVSAIVDRQNPNLAIERELRQICTVKCPESYLQSKGVWYGDESMVRSA